MTGTLRRRLLTLTGFTIAWMVTLAMLPLLLPLLALGAAARRKPGIALRSGLFIAVYLSCEVGGIVASAGLWCWRHTVGISDARWTELHFRLEAHWGATLFRALAWIFDLRIEVEDDADVARGPYLLLVRHSSSGDTLLASALVSAPHRMDLRYVLKRELLWDPCLDIVGNRLPNVFVERDTPDSSGEIERLRALCADLGPRGGVLIYPEGTRFSRAKRERVIERFAESGDTESLACAESLQTVLPPRPGGTLALLEAAPDADVVICAHSGFESAASLSEVWRGALLHRTIHVRFERFARSDLPDGREDQMAWLRAEWREVDRWVAARQAL